jgi:hypothetical protein
MYTCINFLIGHQMFILSLSIQSPAGSVKKNIYKLLNKQKCLAVPHFAEIPFVFFWKIITESETNMTNIKIGNFFGETWTNFAKYGYKL